MEFNLKQKNAVYFENDGIRTYHVEVISDSQPIYQIFTQHLDRPLFENLVEKSPDDELLLKRLAFGREAIACPDVGKYSVDFNELYEALNAADADENALFCGNDKEMIAFLRSLVFSFPCSSDMR